MDKFIEFTVTKKQFIKKYKKVLRKKVFVPNVFYKNKLINQSNNIYLPYYLCNMYAKARVLIDANKESTWISDGYKYKKNDIYSLYRLCESNIIGTTISCSDKIDNEIINQIHPFNFDNMLDYSNDELNNYIYEDCSNKLNKQKIRGKVEDLFIKNIFARIKDYNKAELNKIETAANNFSYCKVLVPIWILNIDYKNKMYYFIMNGQTGKIYYNLPKSKTKVVVIYLILFIIIFLILVLLRGVL